MLTKMSTKMLLNIETDRQEQATYRIFTFNIQEYSYDRTIHTKLFSQDKSDLIGRNAQLHLTTYTTS